MNCCSTRGKNSRQQASGAFFRSNTLLTLTICVFSPYVSSTGPLRWVHWALHQSQRPTVFQKTRKNQQIIYREITPWDKTDCEWCFFYTIMIHFHAEPDTEYIIYLKNKIWVIVCPWSWTLKYIPASSSFWNENVFGLKFLMLLLSNEVSGVLRLHNKLPQILLTWTLLRVWPIRWSGFCVSTDTILVGMHTNKHSLRQW